MTVLTMGMSETIVPRNTCLVGFLGQEQLTIRSTCACLIWPCETMIGAPFMWSTLALSLERD